MPKTNNTTADQIARSHFSASVRRTIKSRGVRVIGLQSIPGEGGDWMNGETGYLVDDNGTGRLWNYAQICAAGGAPMRHAPEMPTMTISV